MKINNNLLKSKRSQEASTITWVVATFIIFFIMILYAIFSLAIFSTKDKAETKLSVIERESEVILTKSLINYLQETNPKGLTNWDVILNWSKNGGKYHSEDYYLIEKSGGEFLDQMNFKCSIIEINSMGSSLIKISKLPSGKEPARERNFLDRALNITYPLNEEKILIIKYFGGPTCS